MYQKKINEYKSEQQECAQQMQVHNKEFERLQHRIVILAGKIEQLEELENEENEES